MARPRYRSGVAGLLAALPTSEEGFAQGRVLAQAERGWPGALRQAVEGFLTAQQQDIDAGDAGYLCRLMRLVSPQRRGSRLAIPRTGPRRASF